MEGFDDLLRGLHRDGFTFREMKAILWSRHRYDLSIDQLKRRAWKRGLYLRKGCSSTEEVLKCLQRIEAWWSQLNKRFTGWWQTFFKDIVFQGLFDNSNVLHINCIRFCFMDILMQQLDSIQLEWNTHRLRKSHLAQAPGGIPDILYDCPELSDSRNYIHAVDEAEIDACRLEIAEPPPAYPASFGQLATAIMANLQLCKPTTPEEGKRLYVSLLEEIDKLED